MGLYEKNLELFKQRAPELFTKFTTHQPIYNLCIEDTDNLYNFVLEYNGARCFIHSLYDTENEMKSMFAHVEENVETLVLFGFGGKYAIEYAIDNFKDLKKLVIIEPSLQHFHQILYRVDMYELLKKFNQISFIINETEQDCLLFLGGLLRNYCNTKISFAFHVSYRSLFKGYYEYVTNNITKELRKKAVNIATTGSALYAFTINTIRNMRYTNIPLHILLNNLNNIPAILVSAGPSLSKNVHLLHQVKDKAFICAVGTAMKVLQSNGITPHVRMAFDGLINEKEKVFKGVDTEAAGLIYADSLYYEILPTYQGPRYKMILDVNHLARYIYEKASLPFEMIKSGFSIANTALDILCKMNCQRIIFMGQDLSFPDGKVYAEGADRDDESTTGLEYQKVKDIMGNEVPTSMGLLSIRYLFEKTIEQYPNIEFINATEGGLPIEGAVNKTMQEVVDSLHCNLNISHIIKEVNEKKFSKQDQLDQKKKIDQVILELKNDISTLERINNRRLRLLKKIRRYRQNGLSLQRLWSEMKTVEQYEEELKKYNFYAQVVYNGLLEIFDSIYIAFEYQGKDSLKLLEAKEKIYFGYTAELYTFLDLLRQLIEEYEKENESVW